MIALIIWIVGLVLTIMAALQIWGWSNVDAVKRILVIIVLLLTSWIGLLVYYFWGKDNLPGMLK
ncbi:MAG: hypothetical protein LBL78_03770 [Prevotellaceae bacterium]|jgi:hypothetical protein|nr:hypothetical protein [Prevotellaceae bacterium]